MRCRARASQQAVCILVLRRGLKSVCMMELGLLCLVGPEPPAPTENTGHRIHAAIPDVETLPARQISALRLVDGLSP